MVWQKAEPHFDKESTMYALRLRNAKSILGLSTLYSYPPAQQESIQAIE